MSRFTKEFKSEFGGVKVAVDVSDRVNAVTPVMVSLLGQGFSGHVHLTADEAGKLAFHLAAAAGIAREPVEEQAA